MTVIFIALLHAVPVFVIAVWTESKAALFVAAIVAGIIGVATGNPAYTFADLIVVAIAFALGISFINDQKPSPATQIDRPAPAAKKKGEDSSWVSGIVVLLILAAFFYNKVTDKPAPSPAPAQVQVQVQQQNFVSPKPVQTSRTGRSGEARKQAAISSNRGSSDVRHCLNLPTDAAIVRCATQGR